MASRIQRTSSVKAFASSFDPAKVQLVADLFQAFGGEQGLTAQQLKQVLQSMHAHCSSKDVQALHSKLDVDGNGLVNQDEFILGLKFIQEAIRLSREREGCDPTDSDSREHHHKGKASSSSESSTLGSRPKLTRGSATSRSFADFAESMDDEEIARMKELFALCDTDGNGIVSKSELRSITEDLGIKCTTEEFDELWKRLDVTGEGLSFHHFLRSIRALQHGMELASEDESPPTLEEQHEILLRYVREVVADTLDLANKSVDAGYPGVAKRVLELIDYDVVRSLEPLVGRLTSGETDTLSKEVTSKLEKTGNA